VYHIDAAAEMTNSVTTR